ncbi:aldo/keto reductase family protein [Alicyclobacillus fodiniaquatilis]|uniref:Aldo/keto reductase family protein n=1 Tax=Alicyclobacillus fodiniaquatilis TaxID=1661150 RepID=A0ABW4JA63_9BACL
MEYRRLGKSGVKVSEIALGSWLTYGTVTEREQAVSCIKAAFELGINHLDCANVYGAQPHEAERFLGEALTPYERDSYVLTTKVFGKVGPGPNDQGLSRKHIFSEIDKSLKALRTDYIDLYYCHRYDENTDLEETLRALDDLIRQGKVHYIGFSEWPVNKIAEAARLQKELGLHPFVASQPEYNIFQRRIEQGVLQLCEDAGIGQAVWSPLAQGVLTGKYKKGTEAPGGSRAATDRVKNSMQRYLNDDVLDKVAKLENVASEADLSLAQLALAWVLRKANVSSALIGASRPAQLEENVKASGVKLEEDILKKIDEIVEA